MASPSETTTPTGSDTQATLRRYDFGFLVVGLALIVFGYLVSPGGAAFWLFILGGTCVAVSSFIRLVRGVKSANHDA